MGEKSSEGGEVGKGKGEAYLFSVFFGHYFPEFPRARRFFNRVQMPGSGYTQQIVRFQIAQEDLVGWIGYCRRLGIEVSDHLIEQGRVPGYFAGRF